MRAGPDIRTTFVTAAGVRTRVLQRDGGDDDAVFIHGLGGWAEQWLPSMEAVAKAGFRAVACDLPGFGESESPGRAVRYFDTKEPYYVRFIAELLAALGVKQATVVGHSLGGSIAAIVAATRPDLVQRLVMVSPGGFSERVDRRLLLCSLPFAEYVAPRAPSQVIHGFVRRNFHAPDRIPKALLERTLVGFRRAEVVRVMSQLVRFGGPHQGLRRAWLDKIKAIRCPTLIVWGREDRLLPPPPASAFAHIQGVQIAMIDEAGHAVMFEQPEQFSAHLIAFLASGTPPRQEPEPASRRTRAASG